MMNLTTAELQHVNKKIFTSKKLGKIDFFQNEIIHFENGLLGFPNLKQFLLIENKELPIFMFLQSIGEDFTFILSSAMLLIENYAVLPHDTKQQKNKDELVFNIVTVSKGGAEISINLLGPILLSIGEKTGRQVVAEGDVYDTKYKIENTTLTELIENNKSLLKYITHTKNEQ